MEVSERGEEKKGSRMEGEGREGKCWSPMLSPPTVLLFPRHPRTSERVLPQVTRRCTLLLHCLGGLAISLNCLEIYQ